MDSARSDSRPDVGFLGVTNMLSAREASRSSPIRHLTVELLAIDLATCGRCVRTEASLESALRAAAARLADEGVEVYVRKVVVRTAEEAERVRLESSPTIRVDGRDIALDLRESPCADCTALCGCGGDVACRVWVWEGREHLEAPEAMIEDAVLRACRTVQTVAPPSAPPPFRLPDNLRRFFAARADGERAGATGDGGCCGSSAGRCGCG